MKLFAQYIKQRRRGIVTGVGFCFIFFVVFTMYHLPVSAVFYPAGLCILLGLILMIIDFCRVKRKHKDLESMCSLIHVITGALPDAEGIEEEDYQRIIRLIVQEYNQYRTDSNRKYSDMIDYYTVWAHQIKTPIASMQLNLQNEDSNLSRKLSSDLFRIEQYAEMVLTFLRLNSENTDYVIKEHDLDQIVKQAVKKFAGEFISRKLTLIYKPLNTTVVTDEKWLSFVIEQILSNALKYTCNGSITIELEPEKKLCVRDTGIGIAPEDLPRIFENGYTGLNGRADKKASGIGLYLCKRICTNLGHIVTAASTVGKGTVMTVDLAHTKSAAE